MAEDRTAWRQATHRGIERADEKKHQHAAEKRMRRKQKAALPPMSSCFVCFGCGKDCHSRIGLHSQSGRCQIRQVGNGARQHRLFETTLCLHDNMMSMHRHCIIHITTDVTGSKERSDDLLTCWVVQVRSQQIVYPVVGKFQ